jgi:hypothetical protein
MPELGAIVSTSVVPVNRFTDATSLPPLTATQPTGAPSSVPKEPVPRISRASGDGAVLGRGTETIATALSVDNSMITWPHPATDGGVTVLAVPVVLVVVVVVDPEETGGRVWGVTPPEPVEALPLASPLTLPAVPPGACGVGAGWAHIAPCGHDGDPGGVVNAGQGADCVQLTATPWVEYERMVTPDELVRLNRNVYGIGPASAGRLEPPAELGVNGDPARPGTVVDGALAVRGLGVELLPTNWVPVMTPEPTRMAAARAIPPSIKVR